MIFDILWEEFGGFSLDFESPNNDFVFVNGLI